MIMIRMRTEVGGLSRLPIIFLAALLLGACNGKPQHVTTAAPPAASPSLTRVERGDLVEVDVTASMEDGALVFTTQKEVAEDPARRHGEDYQAPENFAPEAVVAGVSAPVSGLADAVVGMGVGEEITVVLPPEQAFGKPDPARRIALPCTRTYPRKMRLPADKYVQQFEGFPTVGKEVRLVPYFSSKVMEVGEKEVVLENLPGKETTVKEPFGTVEIKADNDTVTLTLKPTIGASFFIQEQSGPIVETDGRTFTVDLNHPLAGKSLNLQLRAASVTKASSLEGHQINWIEKHDEALAKSKAENKPAVILLYADWCSWCKRLKDESMHDIRVRALQDRFVWAQVNSDVEKAYKEKYRQSSYPMIVLLRPDGTEAGRIDGFRDAAALRRELQKIL